MKQTITRFTTGMGLALLCAASSWAACPPESTAEGTVCVAKFEASAGEIPEGTLQGKSNATLIKKVQQRTVTLKDLTTGGAIQRGVGGALDYPCTDDGNDCADAIYAVSLSSTAEDS